MPTEDFNKDPSGQTNEQFNDVAHQQGQGQTQGGVPGADQAPLNQNNDTGTEALTGSAPQAGAEDETTDNAGTDNFAPPQDSEVEDVDSDQSTEFAGASDPNKSDIELDAEDEVDDHDEDEEIMPSV